MVGSKATDLTQTDVRGSVKYRNDFSQIQRDPT